MRLPNTAHTSRPWRIHELTRDFRLEDVWALPASGGLEEFPRLVQTIASGDPSFAASGAARMLWAIRWTVGRVLGWDSPEAGLGSRVATLRDRLPSDLRDSPSGPDFGALPFESLYLVEDEWAAEIANRTVHGVIHLGWVPEETGAYHGEMAVYVKPNGLLGAAYVAAIKPFRHLIVYPAILRGLERRWRPRDARTGERSSAPPPERPWLVLYDADCGFCMWALSGLLRWDRQARLRPVALQHAEAADLLQELTPPERMASWHLVSPTGGRHSGGAALPPLLRALPGGRLPAAACSRFPGLTDPCYRWVAEHRSTLSALVPQGAKRRAGRRVRERETMRAT